MPFIEIADRDTYDNLLPIFGIASFIFGCGTIFLQRLTAKADKSIEEYEKYLSDKRHCALEMARYLRYQDLDEFDENTLSKNRIEEPHSHNATDKIVYRGYFSDREKYDLIVLKSLEQGLIFRVQEDIILPNSVNRYKTSSSFKPSVFART